MLEARDTPGLVLMIRSTGPRVSAVEWVEPDTNPSASPMHTIMVAY